MKTIIPLLLLTMLTACQTVPPPQKTAQNPEGLHDRELVQVQMDRIAKLERDMERRGNEL